MSNDFDVAIVGGSLGGAAAAAHLGRAGVSVALIDKATFPRRKPCGEGLTSYGLTQLRSLGLDETVLNLPHLPYGGFRVKTLTKAVEMRSPWGSGLTIQRSLLDQAVGNAALSNSSVSSFLGQHVQTVGAHSVEMENNTITADFVIVADGSNSASAKQLRCTEKRFGPKRVGVSATFKGVFSSVPTVITILIKNNFEIYCTPLAGQRLNISILAAEDAPINIREVLLSPAVLDEAFRESSFTGEIELEPMGRVGIGNVRRECHLPSVYLVGDAKEEFDPLAGMGMSHALRSGLLAAEAILRQLDGNSSATSISRWHGRQQTRCVRPMRLFTHLCYRTFMGADKYPFLLSAATSKFSTRLLKSVTRELCT